MALSRCQDASLSRCKLVPLLRLWYRRATSALKLTLSRTKGNRKSSHWLRSSTNNNLPPLRLSPHLYTPWDLRRDGNGMCLAIITWLAAMPAIPRHCEPRTSHRCDGASNRSQLCSVGRLSNLKRHPRAPEWPEQDPHPSAHAFGARMVSRRFQSRHIVRRSMPFTIDHTPRRENLSDCCYCRCIIVVTWAIAVIPDSDNITQQHCMSLGSDPKTKSNCSSLAHDTDSDPLTCTPRYSQP